MALNVIQVDFKKIRKHAKENRWTRLNIARHAGMPPATVYNLFRGKVEPGAVTLKKVCDVIGLPIEDAFTQPKRRAA